MQETKCIMRATTDTTFGHKRNRLKLEPRLLRQQEVQDFKIASRETCLIWAPSNDVCRGLYTPHAPFVQARGTDGIVTHEVTTMLHEKHLDASSPE